MGIARRRAAHIPIPIGLRANARRMRHSMTDAERLLWNTLRGHRVQGMVFRRQVPIAGYIVDFACHQKRLVIEVDGATHSTDMEGRRDAHRTAALEAEGYRVIRFGNDDVCGNLDGVWDRLMAAAGIGVAEA